jgi:hypothetical protein
MQLGVGFPLFRDTVLHQRVIGFQRSLAPSSSQVESPTINIVRHCINFEDECAVFQQNFRNLLSCDAALYRKEKEFATTPY